MEKEFVNNSKPECSSELLWVWVISESTLSSKVGGKIFKTDLIQLICWQEFEPIVMQIFPEM